MNYAQGLWLLTFVGAVMVGIGCIGWAVDLICRLLVLRPQLAAIIITTLAVVGVFLFGALMP